MDFENMSDFEIYNYALKLFENGDIDNAIKYITIAAENGCSEAMLCLAKCIKTAGVLNKT